MAEIKLGEGNLEIVPYNIPSFPVHAREYWLSYYPNKIVSGHWHDDFEFIVILRGNMNYRVNGKEILLKEGQCLFINSKSLHSTYPVDECDCQFLCFLFHPSLLSITKEMRNQYVEFVHNHRETPFYLYTNTMAGNDDIIKQLMQIFHICQETHEGYELEVISNLYTLWLVLYRNFKNIKVVKSSQLDKRWDILYNMIRYIKDRYPQKIILHDIAQSGNVCRSSCCQIFSELLHVTPIQYLTQYRLEKSIEYMHHSSCSITEIALLCGFNSSSYFTEVFHRTMGRTPSQYMLHISEMGPL